VGDKLLTNGGGKLKLAGMLLILVSIRLCGCLCLALVSELDALIGTPFCPLGIALLLLFQPLSMIVVVGHVRHCAMMRAPLYGGPRNGILHGLFNLGVVPFVGWLFITFASRLGIRLVVLGGSLAASGIIELLSLRQFTWVVRAMILELAELVLPQLPSATLLRYRTQSSLMMVVLLVTLPMIQADLTRLTLIAKILLVVAPAA
jgi:hypothetical protein